MLLSSMSKRERTRNLHPVRPISDFSGGIIGTLSTGHNVGGAAEIYGGRGREGRCGTIGCAMSTERAAASLPYHVFWGTDIK
jgi:hypothetical protein